MTPFDKYYSLLEKVIEPSYGPENVPHAREWVPGPELISRASWPGQPPAKWKGLALINNKFNANNAGPFEFALNWVRDYIKLTSAQQDKIELKFKNFLNSPTRETTVEIKRTGALGTICVWQMDHDIYQIFTVKGDERKVIWLRLFDDHDTYNSYLKTGRAV